MAPLAVGIVTALTGSQAGGMSVVLVFFAVGFALMLWVTERRTG